MNKDEYREEVLKQLREMKLDIEIIGIFSVISDALLFIIMFVMIIVLFK